jgi:hypothetical protein
MLADPRGSTSRREDIVTRAKRTAADGLRDQMLARAQMMQRQRRRFHAPQASAASKLRKAAADAEGGIHGGKGSPFQPQPRQSRRCAAGLTRRPQGVVEAPAPLKATIPTAASTATPPKVVVMATPLRR